MSKWKQSYKIKSLICFLGISSMILVGGCGNREMASDQVWGRADAKEIDINTKVAGRVIQLNVKEGDHVKAGDVIAYINRRDLEAKKSQQEAVIASLTAQKAEANSLTSLESGTTKSALEKAASNLALSERDYKRYEELLSKGAVSRQAYDMYKTKYETAQADYDSARSNMLKNQVNQSSEEAIDKNIDAARAALDSINVSLDETVIRAPFDGIITEKYIEEGSMLSLGTPLVAIQDPTDNWIDIKVPETHLSRYHLHDIVTLIGRDNRTKIQGEITDISKKADFATDRATSERGSDTDIISFNVKVQVNSNVVRPGMRFRLEREEE